MPRPTGSETSYVPGLDGVRAIALAAVVGYHLGAPWLPGGLLGVGVFFTLSGYLIRTILLTTWERSGNLDLGHFWLRRARRWFINDGIHFTTRGYAERGKRTAETLATAFPKQGSSPGECLIRP
jgi:hypothetical protein